jgi:NADH:ubiquinone oxidoreductase subunit 5 (subunit L)/multisubunit Na+/H+ antiporter MnhA subunit
LLLTPLVSFVLAISSIRTRRSASAMAMFGTVVTLLLTLLVAWGLTRRSTPFVANYQYFNLSVAFSGPTNFQSFGIQFVLHADKLTVAALLAIELCIIGALGWHQVMGRSEPGAARFHAAITALLFACVGVLLSYDLAELFAFWAIGGAMTYLLLGHRWGLDDAAARARVALALPFLTDICLLCGIAWLYSRYGTQNLTTLIPILHTNPGWTVRSLVVGSVLLFVGVAGRLPLWPFTSWVTQTAITAPPAAVAIVQSVWSVLAIVVLYRLMPIFTASSPQAMQVFAVSCAAVAVIAPLLTLFGNEPRRIVVLVGSGVAAIGAAVVFQAFRGQASVVAIAGVAIVLAAAPARAGAMLAISNLAAAMRTDDMAEMGDAWRRMRASSVALLASIVVVGLSACGALAYGFSTRSKLGLALGDATLLIAIGGLRLFLGASLGPLRRRRAFEPDRVREAPREVLGYPYWLAVAGAAFLVASLLSGWLNFLDGQKHSNLSLGTLVVWVAVPIVGFAAVTFVYSRGKDGALALSAAGGVWLDRVTTIVLGLVSRFLIEPVTDIARRIGDWVPEGDGALGRFSVTSGQLALAAARAPAVQILVVLAAVLALIFALVAPGLAR